jgi:hypothetical protein
MKIDFKKLAKVEKEYRYDNPVCQNTLQTMIDLVLSNRVEYDATGLAIPTTPSYTLALKTLIELGVVIDETETPKVTQINS